MTETIIFALVAVIGCADAYLLGRAKHKSGEGPTRCGNVVAVSEYRNGLTLAPGAYIAVKDDETGEMLQFNRDGIWRVGMRACSEPK